MQLTESVFTPERQQINTIQRAHLCLTGKPKEQMNGQEKEKEDDSHIHGGGEDLFARKSSYAVR